MKRGLPLKRRKPLQARSRLRTRPKPRVPRTPARDALCAYCGEAFISRPTHLGWTSFCSRACYGASNRKPVKRECVSCGKSFETTPSRTQRTCLKPECVSAAKSRARLGVKRAPEVAEKSRRSRLKAAAAREAGLPIPARGKCARSGCQNPLTRQAAKYCSPRCHYEDRSVAGGRKREQPYHRCRGCGTVFAWNGRGRGIFCSRDCKDQHAAGPVRVEPDVVEVVQLRGHRRADFIDDTEACRACGGPAQHTHHVVYRQHIERLKGDRWHPDDALALCVQCHGRAHAHQLPLSVLRGENLAFAIDFLGAYAVDYLRRYYHDDGDLRVAAMAERVAA